MIQRIFPKNSRRRKVVAKIRAHLMPAHALRTKPYNFYMQRAQDQQAIDDETFAAYNNHPEAPLISLIIPLYNTPNKYLEPLVASVMNQRYEHWELLLVDEKQAPEGSARDRLVASDDRIKHVAITKNTGISTSTNAGFEAATGDFIAFADHDDVLEADALFEVARAVVDNPDIGLVYTDEGKLSDDGEIYSHPHFKPDWSPDLMRNLNYITHFVAVKKSIVDKVGGLNPDRDGAQDYDFLLRVIDESPKIVHIPRILYQWRLAANSTARNFSVKPKALKAGAQSLQDHLDRNKLKAKAEILEGKPGFYRVKYQDDTPDQNALALYLHDNYTQLDSAYLAQSYMDIAEELGCPLFINRLPVGIKSQKQTTIIKAADSFDFMKKVASTWNGYATFVADSVVPDNKKDVAELFALAKQPHVFAAAPRVITESDDKVIDMGLVRCEGLLVPLFAANNPNENTLFGDTSWVRNVDALSGRVFAASSKNLKVLGEGSKGYFSVNPERFELSDSETLVNTVWAFSTFKKVHLQHKQQSLGGRFYNPNITIENRPTITIGEDYDRRDEA